MATPIPDNAATFSLDELGRACSGSLVETGDRSAVTGISTDSRRVREGQLFVALAGESHDGHDHVDAARERGALPLVARSRSIPGPRIEVEDPLAALGAIGRAWLERRRARRALPILAVGGSAGKTTTRNLAAAAARALFGETLVTAGNLNNRIGVPMTLLTLDDRHRAAVIECGTSEPGEIAELGRILGPDVGLVTNVGIEHSEKLGSLAEIAVEEGSLLRAARRAAVTLADEPLLTEQLASVPAPERITFGTAAAASVRVTGRDPLPDGRCEVRLEVDASTRLSIRTPLLGTAGALNLAAAFAGVTALLGRPSRRQELDAVAEALGAVEPVAGRMRPLELGGILVLDDSYNSNPKSLAASLEAAAELARRRGSRLVVALGDMLELGALAAEAHETMVRSAHATGAARIVLIGAESSAAGERLRAKIPSTRHPDVESAAGEIARLVSAGDVLLVKGSRGMRTERLLDELAPVSEAKP